MDRGERSKGSPCCSPRAGSSIRLEGFVGIPRACEPAYPAHSVRLILATREIQYGVWVIPPERTKNSHVHQIPLGRWARSLIEAEGDWVIPAARSTGPRISGWDFAIARVKRRMERIAGQPIARFTSHDFRRTARSNTKRLGVDYETAEAMLNHVKRGLERTYDRYELEDEKREWFDKWEREIASIAFAAGVADALGVPIDILPSRSPESACVEPG